MWAAVEVGILFSISAFGMVGSLVSVSDFNGTGNTGGFVTNASGFYAWSAFAIVCLVVLYILAGFTICRICNPLKTTVPEPVFTSATPLATIGSLPVPWM